MGQHAEEIQVLVVDDDAIMGELLDALLTVEGFRVTRALSGDEALEVALGGRPKPNVILCDIQMPGMRGGELARTMSRLRAEGTLDPECVILAMSGSSPRPSELEAFDGALSKPFSVADFWRAIDEARARTPDAAGSDQVAALEGVSLLPPLDENIFEQLRAKIGPDSLRQLYDMTLEDVRTRIQRIAGAAERGDEATARHEAHTIKGSCGMVGALELQSLAAATEGGSPLDTSALADFDSACKRLERMLNEKL